LEIVLSTTTQTGFALARKKHSDRSVFYCPLDFTWATAAAMRRVMPDVLVLAELELWPNLVRAARRSGARVAVINGRLSEKSFQGYQRIRPIVARLLQSIDLVAVQSEEYAERFRCLGARPESLHVTGSVKFDGAQSDRRNSKTEALRALAGLADGDKVFLAGSTQRPEERLAVETFRTLQPAHPKLRLVLVPRHPERFEEVAQMLDASGLSWQRRSNLDQAPPSRDARILLVDTVGELGAWWGAADIGFVGGSLGSRGGQNMIEPAAYGAAVCFGPNTKNFRDVVAMLMANDAAVVVRDNDELTAFVRRCLEDAAFASELGRRARATVAAGRGATRATVDELLALCPGRNAPDVRPAA
jgi:3-deoxy-D-manno-octulosonic-acid transferase